MNQICHAHFAHIDTWLFDMDNTLYEVSNGLLEQIHERMHLYLMQHYGIHQGEAITRRQALFQQYGTTLMGLIQTESIDPHYYLEFVHDIDISNVNAKPELAQLIARLPGRKLVFTNAAKHYALKVAQRLGIYQHFEAIFDIADAGFVSKPNQQPYQYLCQQHKVKPNHSAFFDDMSRNLIPAAQMGMRTIWVNHNNPQSNHYQGHTDIHFETDNLTQFLQQQVLK